MAANQASATTRCAAAAHDATSAAAAVASGGRGHAPLLILVRLGRPHVRKEDYLIQNQVLQPQAQRLIHVVVAEQQGHTSKLLHDTAAQVNLS